MTLIYNRLRCIFALACTILVAFFWRNYLTQMMVVTKVEVYHVTINMFMSSWDIGARNCLPF